MPASIGLPGGFTVPIPRWAISGFGVIALVGISAGVYRHFYPAEPELVSVQQANHTLRLEVDEYNKHIVELPVATLADPQGTVSVRQFADGCLVVWQRRGTMSSTRLLVDPARMDVPHRRGDEHAALGLVAVVAAAEPGKCLSPHPGEFQTRYGEKMDQCWVQVYRRWPDGCEQVQLFNFCSNAWATNADGTPRVAWTHCVH